MSTLALPSPPRAGSFSATLAVSLALHLLVLGWLWWSRPERLEVAMPGATTVELVGEAPAPTPVAAPAQGPVAPPAPKQRDEVQENRKKPLPPAHKPTPPQARPSTPPPNSAQTAAPGATSAQAAASNPAEAHLGVSGTQGVSAPNGLGYYLATVRNRISQNWGEPAVNRRTVATVFFRIARDGSVKDARVETRSGSPVFDQVALRAVQAAAPFPPLPDSFQGGELGVHFDFEVAH